MMIHSSQLPEHFTHPKTVNNSNSSPTMPNSLGLFAKYWQPGKVKTRLAKSIGDVAASKAYQMLLGHHIHRFGALNSQNFVVYSPDRPESLDRFQKFTACNDPDNRWQFVPQVTADLGNRMNSFFEQRFQNQNQRVVVIGSDAPQLTVGQVEHAFELLEESDVVFGPSSDGGYYLVGLSQPAPRIFEQIEWSTEQVLEQSLQRCQESNLNVKLLDTLTDIDEGPDLIAALKLLEDQPDPDASKLHADLTSIDEVAQLLQETNS